MKNLCHLCTKVSVSAFIVILGVILVGLLNAPIRTMEALNDEIPYNYPRVTIMTLSKS